MPSFASCCLLGTVMYLQEELIALQPQLEESTRQTEAAMEAIATETMEADKVKKVWMRQCTYGRPPLWK